MTAFIGINLTKSETKQADPIQIKREQLIWPTVMIKSPEPTFGSGTIIDKKCDNGKCKYYILTVKHITDDRNIVQKYRPKDFITGANRDIVIEGKFEVTLYTFNGKVDRKVIAKFEDEIESDGIDAGIISFELDEDLCNIAKIADDNIFGSLNNLVDVYMSACPLRQNPVMTMGNISDIEDDTGQIISSGNAAFGSSGGGLYTKVGEDYYLIGVLTGIGKTEDNRYAFSFLVTSTSVKSIRDFLTKNGI